MTNEQLRAEFEAWALAKWPGATLSPDQNNCGITIPERYKHPKLQAAWEAWQASRTALQSKDREVDPLQTAVNWLNDAVVDLTATDIQQRLSIGYNRAQILLDHACRVEE